MTRNVNHFVWPALVGLAILATGSPPSLFAADLLPVGYWALDDGQANPYSLIAADSSGNWGDGTLWNFPEQPAWMPGVLGGSLKFDGADDRVEMSSAWATDITGAVSLSLWMGRLGSNASSYASLAGKNASGGSSYDGYHLSSLSSSQIAFGITPAVGDPVTLTSVAAVPNGTWHHVAAVFDPGVRMAIYVDGVLDNELTTGVPTEIRSVATPFAVGNLSSSSSTYGFNGYLDEVAVFNGALGAAQIQSMVTSVPPIPSSPTTAVLVGHWALDDGQANPASTTAADSTTGGSNGTLLNFDSPPSWDAGAHGGALRFDGTNDRVDVGATTPLDVTDDLSMAFWLKPSGTGAAKYGALVGKNQSGGASEDGYFTDLVYTKSVTGAAVPQGTIEFAITQNDANTVLRSNTTLDVNEDAWHHVAVTFDAGGRMALYLDGVLDSELVINIPTACDSTTAPFTLGNLGLGSSVDTYCFNGLLDDVRMYTGVLTDAEIALLAKRVSLPGDTDNDGDVDDADAAVLAGHWLATVSGGAQDGDFNGDKVVDDRDAAILAAHWQRGTEGHATVPEPASWLLLLSGLVGLLMRRALNRRGPREG